MSNQPHWCPVCDYGGGAALGSVRSHVNAETSEGHDWTELREQVEAQQHEDSSDEGAPPDGSSEQQAEPAGEQREASETSPSGQAERAPEGAPSDGSDDEEAESGGEHPEGGESSPSEQGENGSEMATQEEYNRQQQRQQADSGDEGSEKGAPSGDSPSDGEQSPTGDHSQGDSGGSGGLHVPAVGGTTLLLLAGLVLVAFIAWKVLGGDDVDYEDPEEQADADDASTQMVDVDAGTGGVYA